MKVLSEMLASSKELELLCPGEALDKQTRCLAHSLLGTRVRTGGQAANRSKWNIRLEVCRIPKHRSTKKGVCFVFHSKAKQMFAVFLVAVILKLWVERSTHGGPGTHPPEF